MKIYIVRHTSVDVPLGTCYGQTDVPLKDTFQQEAEVVKQKLAKANPDAVFSSPLSRCRRLAEYCGYDEIQFRDRLKELFFGDWEMRHTSELDLTQWNNDRANARAPHGETFKEMYKRVASFFDEIKKEDYSEVVVFAHGGVLNCTKAYFNKTELTDTFQDMEGYGAVLEFTL